MAALSVLHKPIQLSESQILFLLWCRIFVFEEDWDRSQGPDLAQVWNYALGGNYMSDAFAEFVANAEFLPISSADGHEAISEILDMMRYEWDPKNKIANTRFQVTKFGSEEVSALFPEAFFKDDLLRVLRIKDDWNKRTYFFETPAAFCYFSWGTSA